MDQYTAVFVRHSKTERHAAGGDSARELTDRGRQDARQLGMALQELIGSVDTVFVSTAMRARQTWEQMAVGAGVEAETIDVRIEERIYSGSPEGIFRMVTLEASGPTAIVVGHEPTISSAATFAVEPGDAEEFYYGVPTSTAIVTASDLEWGSWQPHCARLVQYLEKQAGF